MMNVFVLLFLMVIFLNDIFGICENWVSLSEGRLDFGESGILIECLYGLYY